MKKKDVELVEYLARIYRHDQLMLLMSDGLAVCEGEGFERYLQAEDFVNLIDMYLESLSDEQQLLLRNTFFNCQNKEWFKNFYSKSAYRRKKEEAVEAFVRCFTS